MRRYHLILILFAIASFTALFFAIFFIPARASRLYGPPAAQLSISQRIQYSALLLWYGDDLLTPLSPGAPEQTFIVDEAESVRLIAIRLEENGIISNSNAFRDYLIYTGLDVTLQAGRYSLSPGMSIVDIAREMQDATPEDVTFVVLPGWRMEEIAASLPTSGLIIAPEQFLAVANNPLPIDSVEGMISNEGFFFPDSYILPRETTAEQLVDALTRSFAQHLTQDLRDGFSAHGLTVYQAVTLASIVEREAIQAEESPLIASVYLNRLNIGMKLDADPTVQYALGFDATQNTWWTNPLGLEDLQVNSPYNTYLISGPPPAPISNPGMDALRAVAFPADTSYFFFRAKCDDGGYHVFEETFEEHLQNACP
ncbi:MAG: endolytic transglycosylase MltG [Chloroflexi bacterium]|nr:endolytic transglycosylase MltG [Chloroflexota bacterium]